MKKQFFVVSISLVFLSSSICLAVDRLVPSQYSTIQDAINASINGDTVIVSPGTYTGVGNRDIDFGGKAITVRGTNPEDPCVVVTTIIDCSGTLSEQHRGFYFHSSEGSGSVVSGITIKNGYISGLPAQGGGIYCNGSSPKIENCTVSNNNAYGTDGSCESVNGGAAYGGAIYCAQSNAIINNCAIASNKAQGGGGSEGCQEVRGTGGNAYGGGIYSDPNSNIVISNCTIGSNLARGGNGGWDEIYTGGGVGDGIGGGVCGKSTITNCLIYGNNVSCGSSFDDYSGCGYGGGVANNNLSISNCTIVSNIAYGDYESVAAVYGSSMIVNCIIWSNDAISGVIVAGGATMTYSDIQGGYSGTGNINTNPLFAAGPLGNYYLSQIAAGQASNSPCVNTGSDTAINLGMDTKTTRTDELRDIGIVDMGYHYPVPALPDIDENYIVDFIDFAILANDWQLQSGYSDPNYLTGDITKDLYVNFADLLELAEAWLDCLVGAASTPNPANNTENVDPNVIFVWTAGEGALEHDVYLGTDANAVAGADHLSPEYMDTVSDVNFDPCLLDSGTTYFWRIDEIGPRCTAKGNTWNFKTYTEYNPNLGLVGWWKFDEGSGTIANDSSGHDNNGTIYGGATWTTGQIDGALNFDGSNDYVAIPDDDNSLDMDNQMTISAWIRVSNLLNKYYFIVTKQPSGTAGNAYPGNYEFRVRQNDGYLQFLHQTSTGTTLTDYASTSPVTTGVWYHVAVTLQEGVAVKFYINGAPAGTLPQTTTFGITNNEPVKIGNRKDSKYSYGAMDDVRIYNRALSDAEIQQIYESGL